MQIEGDKGLTVMTGSGLTVTVTLVLLEHPLLSVPVTIYVAVVEGSATTDVPTPEDNPVAGLHA
jgi:hypothetical protein